jgi:hypothetical protein
MRKTVVKKLRRKANVDYLIMLIRHPDLKFKRFFRTVKRLYLRRELTV